MNTIIIVYEFQFSSRQFRLTETKTDGVITITGPFVNIRLKKKCPKFVARRSDFPETASNSNKGVGLSENRLVNV